MKYEIGFYRGGTEIIEAEDWNIIGSFLVFRKKKEKKKGILPVVDSTVEYELVAIYPANIIYAKPSLED